MRRRFVLAGLLLLLLGSASVLGALYASRAPGCSSLVGGRVEESQLSSKTFGAVTTFSLPAPGRWPNAITVAPDGSVWFGEEGVPALAHLFATNGTLVEYLLPGAYQPISTQGYTCTDRTYIWGVALWDGRVWAADSAQNRLVGLGQSNDSFKVVKLSTSWSLPYTLTPGPDSGLWFTQIDSGEVGTLYDNGTVVEHSVTVPEHLNGTSATVYVPGVPAQIAFAGGSMAYYVDASPLIKGSPVFAFDPAHFNPNQIGGNQSLSDPDSIALGDGSIWLAQHGDSSIARYDTVTGNWTIYPTSSVTYIGPTLPYFVETNGSLVWFNEHFGNRMAVLDVPGKTLTEYSLSDPPATDISKIGGALTSAIGGGRAWFAESSSNVVGFVDASYRPSFSISANGNSTLSLSRGGRADLTVDLTGNSSSPISIQTSESLSPGLTNANITMRPDFSGADSLTGNRSIDVSVDVGPSVVPGNYTLLVTATDGMISRTAYVALAVLP